MNTAPGHTRILVLAIALATVGGGCRRDAPVATLLEAAGTAERAHAGDWTAAVAGTSFVIGDSLRTGPAARARLSVATGGVIRVGENARIRFQRGTIAGQQAPDLALEMGSAEVDETTAEMSIVMPAGSARIQRATHVRVNADGSSASLEVLVGRAVMMEAGHEVAIDVGQGVRIRLGTTVIERFAVRVRPAVLEPAADPAQKPATPPEMPPPAVAEPAPPEPEPAEPVAPHPARGETGRADLTLTAGESATIHEGRPVATVRLRVQPLCPGQATVTLRGHGHPERFVGSGAVILRLKAGTRSYHVQCEGAPASQPGASGVLSLRRDTGDVPLPRRPPANVIDADGRRYTVLFQTRLPQLTLAWPDAPAGADRLQLHLDAGGTERVIEGASLRRPLAAGTLAEGTYTFWYRAPNGTQSPRTTLSIRFDNAAPTAQFFRPTGPAKGAAGAVIVDGVTVDGAKVSVGGQPVAVDARGRFRTEAAPLEGDDAVAVRLEHPRTGVHYYVRR
ncbi:MAG TPA: FecR domain-containing protein [Polyangia bacterium]|nr:FecR domain-containing protein [Polyangia bacterium]